MASPIDHATSLSNRLDTRLDSMCSTFYDLRSSIYNHDEATGCLYFDYFVSFSNRLMELVDPVLLHVYAYEVILSRGDPTTR